MIFFLIRYILFVFSFIPPFFLSFISGHFILPLVFSSFYFFSFICLSDYFCFCRFLLRDFLFRSKSLKRISLEYDLLSFSNVLYILPFIILFSFGHFSLFFHSFFLHSLCTPTHGLQTWGRLGAHCAIRPSNRNNTWTGICNVTRVSCLLLSTFSNLSLAATPFYRTRPNHRFPPIGRGQKPFRKCLGTVERNHPLENEGAIHFGNSFMDRSWPSDLVWKFPVVKRIDCCRKRLLERSSQAKHIWSWKETLL